MRDAPPILFLVLPKKRMRRARWKRKSASAGEGWRSLAAVRDENAFPLGVTKPGEIPDTFSSSFRWRYPGGLPGFPL